MTLAPLYPLARKKIRGLHRPLREWMRQREYKERKVALSLRPAEITLEMTARCNLICVTCRRYHVHEEHSNVRGVYGAKEVNDIVGSSGYMAPQVFERAVDLARDANSVDLAGYGEPMMNPNFHEYARILKRRGHRLNTISNGTLLNKKNIQKLIDNRFDRISVSIDGVEEKTLKIVRGVDKTELFDNLELFQKMKAERGLGPDDAPRLSVSFVMARFNIREMPKLARKLAELGLNNFYAQNLEAEANPQFLGKHLLYTDPEVRDEAMRHIEETKRFCTENGITYDIKEIPTEPAGWEPEGIPLDESLDAFNGTALSNVPPKRNYRPLDEIEAERQEAVASCTAPGVAHLPKKEKADSGRLSPLLERENLRCPDFFWFAFVAWNGKVLSCCFERHGVGDLNLQTAEEIWNGETYRHLRRSYFERGIRSVCEGCSRIME